MEEKQELIVVRQLPEIEEHLRSFKQLIEAEVEKATALICTEDTLNEVKKARANLNAEYKRLEEQRIAVKKQILAPYDEFEKVYKECVSDAFKAGNIALGENINAVEHDLKQQKEERVKEYYNELCAALNIDFVDFNRLDLNITRSISLKKYQEMVKEKLERIAGEVTLIGEQEYSEEIMVEYKESLNAPQAIVRVKERHRAIEEEKKKAQESVRAAVAREQAASMVEEVLHEAATAPMEPLNAPEPIEPQKVYEVTFTVRGTKEMIKELKSYLIEGGYVNE